MWKPAVGIVCVLMLSACSGSSKGSSTSKPSSSTPPTVASTSIDPCALISTHDATLLVGKKVTRQPSSDSNPGGCTYAPSADSETSVEVAVKIDPDDAFAQADYPAWVQSVLNAPGFTVTPMANLGDGGTRVNSPVFDAILFRQGSILVKIGAGPKASNAALQHAASTALSRL